MRSEGECANPIGRWSVPIDLCVCVCVCVVCVAA